MRSEEKTFSPTKWYSSSHNRQPGQTARDKASVAASRRETEGLIIKLVRLLANVSISREIGPLVASIPGIEVLVALVRLHESLFKSDANDDKDNFRGEELLLNIICTAQNLSYYADPSDGLSVNRMWDLRSDISRSLAPLLFHANEEVVLESVSAFGNFSKDAVGFGFRG